MSDETERSIDNSQVIHARIQAAIAKESCEEILPAIILSMAAVIGVMSADRQAANLLCTLAIEDVRAAMLRNWDDIKRLGLQDAPAAGEG